MMDTSDSQWTLPEMQRLSPSQYQTMIAKAAGQGPKKYRNKKTYVGSHSFDSIKESRRFSHLFIMQQRGEISELELQPVFPLIINGMPIRDSRGVIRKYKADFRYLDKSGRRRVEDVKSKGTERNPVYRLKRDLMRAAYPDIEIEEV